MNLLKRCIKLHGLYRGGMLYLILRYQFKSEIIIHKVRTSIYFRPKTSDIESFKQIFIEEQYNYYYIHKFIKDPKIIIDAGANIGLATLYFANTFINAKIFAIEPEVNNFKILEKNTKKYPNIKLYNNALWYNKTGVEIVDMNYGEWGYMTKEIDKDSDKSIPSFSLNDLLVESKIDIVDILKIDIEGSEIEIFSHGYEDWLPKVKCLIIELHDRMRKGCSKSVFNAISKYNFSFYQNGENLVFFNDDFVEIPLNNK